jgi:uncharacterized protein
MLMSPGPFAPRKIAVIGAGISGMGAAYRLADHHHVVLYEAEGRLGGHARTRMGGRRGDQPVDTGFIVFNRANYPHLVALFNELDVPVVKSDMSFAASVRGGTFEYGLHSLRALFGQAGQVTTPAYWRMLRDVLRFNRGAEAASREPGLTVAGLMDRLGVGPWFRDYYIAPLSGAIWSTPTEKIMDFPAEAMIRFFRNHALLGVYGQHQWWTVQGGSASYVRRLGDAMRGKGVDIRLSSPIAGVRRTIGGVEVRAEGGQWERFDEVVFATHSDDTLRLLSDPTPQERRVLGAIRYQPNQVVLHSDPSVMPKSRAVWASWNYAEAADSSAETIDLTYWMNRLQPWLVDEPLFGTLNSRQTIREDLIWDQTVLRHPVYDLAAFAAQEQAAVMNGDNNTWFCGAWMKNGFHEDGLSSAMDVVARIAARPALAVAAE